VDHQHWLCARLFGRCVRTATIIPFLALNLSSFIPHGSKYFHPPHASDSDYLAAGPSTLTSTTSSLSDAVQLDLSILNPLPSPPNPPLVPPPVAECSTQASLWPPPLSAPAPLGLPIYSSSGFDLFPILVRIANRKNPTINLGPVDMSCSFVVVDVRRYDSPIVYASPPFYRMTGYEENEVLGRNCRFLQAPGGRVAKGEHRQYTNQEAVAYMRKCLAANKECQTNLFNYRKDGSNFINLVTIIPLAGGIANGPEEQNDVAFHVGFQVDLTEQPNTVLEKLRDGSYMTNNSYLTAPNTPGRDRRNPNYVFNAVSEELRGLLCDPTFVSSISPPTSSAEDVESQERNNPLSLLLLNAMPDFLLVLSLKGSFLYIAPSITRVLEYSADELAGKSIRDYCHPADVVPLTRELKESSAILGPQEAQRYPSNFVNIPKTVNLLFRARTKSGPYIWIECTGRLHVEPGKGRKAIILSARPRTMPRFSWRTMPDPVWQDHAVGRADASREVWGMLSLNGTVLFMSPSVKNVLGWGVAEIIGMSLNDIVLETSSLGAALHRAAQGNHGHTETVEYRFRQKSGSYTNLNIVFHPLPAGADSQPELRQLPIICQIRPIQTKSTVDRQFVTSVSRGNVFSDAPKEGSWQFELQQLKLKNQELAAEVEFLEGSVGLQKQQQQQATSASASSSSTHKSAEWTSHPHHPLKRR